MVKDAEHAVSAAEEERERAARKLEAAKTDLAKAVARAKTGADVNDKKSSEVLWVFCCKLSSVSV